MFILTLSHMGMVVLLLGGQYIDSKMMTGGVNGRENLCPPLFSPGFQLVSPQSHPFSSSLTDCDRVVYNPKNFKEGGLVEHLPSSKDRQVEGLDPE